MTLADERRRRAATLDARRADSPVITGTLTDGSGHPLANYRVVALGRWDASAPLTEVSTVDYTRPTASTRSRSPTASSAPIEIVATPYDPACVAPTLHLRERRRRRRDQQLAAAGANLGNRVAVDDPDHRPVGDGAVEPGRRRARDRDRHARRPACGGTAAPCSRPRRRPATTASPRSTLLDGATFASGYTHQVVPPASSSSASCTTSRSTLRRRRRVRLPVAARAPRHGRRRARQPARQRLGDRAAVAAVRVEPDAAGQAFLAEIPPPTDGDARQRRLRRVGRPVLRRRCGATTTSRSSRRRAAARRLDARRHRDPARSGSLHDARLARCDDPGRRVHPRPDRRSAADPRSSAASCGSSRSRRRSRACAAQVRVPAGDCAIPPSWSATAPPTSTASCASPCPRVGPLKSSLTDRGRRDYGSRQLQGSM